jgi:hypothetical protein
LNIFLRNNRKVRLFFGRCAPTGDAAMAHAATYLRKLAEHYQTLAATMTFN